MSFGGDGSTWITGILMALTVVVGLLGISRDHHRTDGRLTRVGRGLVVAIILLGVVTFFSGLRDERIAHEKELADSAARDRQFQTQMSALRGVTGSLSELQTGMRGSLAQQERLFGVASRTLGMSETLQRQAQENTLVVLRRVFAESNRISSERIAISVGYLCIPGEDPDEALPRLDRATLLIRGARGGSISLSTDQKLSVEDGVIFHGFLGDLGIYETFPAWRSARINIVLHARPATLGRSLSVDTLRRRAELEERLAGRQPQPPVCNAGVMLLLNGRQMLTAFGTVAIDRNGQWGVEFSDLRVEQNRLPSFPR